MSSDIKEYKNNSVRSGMSTVLHLGGFHGISVSPGDCIVQAQRAQVHFDGVIAVAAPGHRDVRCLHGDFQLQDRARLVTTLSQWSHVKPNRQRDGLLGEFGCSPCRVGCWDLDLVTPNAAGQGSLDGQDCCQWHYRCYHAELASRNCSPQVICRKALWSHPVLLCRQSRRPEELVAWPAEAQCTAGSQRGIWTGRRHRGAACGH